ncbi:MAG: hypothetical protein V1834_02320 [Candidatus Micrarchaeota archaeon]
MRSAVFLLLIGFFSLSVSAINISSCQTLNAPGEYYLNQDVQQPEFRNCFWIPSGGVVLDCQGHSISIPYTPQLHSSIPIASDAANVEVRNCVLRADLFSSENGIIIYPMGNDPIQNLTVTGCVFENLGYAFRAWHALLPDPHTNALNFSYNVIKNGANGFWTNSSVPEQGLVFANNYVKVSGTGAVINSLNPVFENNTFVGGMPVLEIGQETTAVNVSFDKDLAVVYAPLTVDWFLSVKAVNKAGSPISGALVSVYDVNDDSVFEGFTGESGWFGGKATEYVQFPGPTKEFKTPTSIVVSKDSYVEEALVTLDANKQVELQLDPVKVKKPKKQKKPKD